MKESNTGGTRGRSIDTLVMLCEGAVCVAMAHVLGYLKIWHMPQGGSVSLLMLPVLFFAARRGFGAGALAGVVLGILQFAFDGGIAIGWQSILGDYVIACALLGLAGVFHSKKWGFFPGIALGALGRYAAIVVTGATLWGAYMPEEFWGMSMANPWVYSMLYNVPILVSGVLCVLLAAPLYAVPALRIRENR